MTRTIGSVRLRNWLAREGRTQQWLAARVGTRQTQISRYVLGARTPPIAIALAIAKVTGIKVDAWAKAAPDADESGPLLVIGSAHEGAA